MDKITLDIAVNNTESIKSLKDIKDAVKLLKSEALNIGEGGPGFTQLTEKAGQLQDKLSDVNDTIRVLSGNSVENFNRSFTNLASTAVGAFGAIQGAQALFGTESEELQRTLVKLQGLMNLSNGIREFANIGQAAKDFKVVLSSLIPTLFAQTTATEGVAVAQNGLNIAMKANPIGLVVAAITALVTALVIYNTTADESIDVTDGLTVSEEDYQKSLKDTNAQIDKRIGKLKDNISLMGLEGEARDLASIAIERNSALEEAEDRKKEARIPILQRILELRQKLNEELDKEAVLGKDPFRDKLIKKYEAEIESVRQEGVVVTRKVEEEKKLIIESSEKASLQVRKKYNNEQNKDREEQLKKEQEEFDELKRKDKEKLDDLKLFSENVDTLEREASINKRLKKEEDFNIEVASEMDRQKALNDIEINAFFEKSEQIRRRDEEDKENRIKNTDEFFQYSKLGLESLDSLNSLVSTIQTSRLKGNEKQQIESQKRAFNRTKALGIVNAGINAAVGITAVLRDTGAEPIETGIRIAAIGLTTLSQIALIASKKFDAGSTTDAQGGNNTPTLPNTNTNTTNTVSNGQFLNIGDYKAGENIEKRVYVVESDITGVQRKVQVIENRSTY